MKFLSSKFGFCAVAALGLALTAAFTACGDENTTEVVESNGMGVLANGEKIPECTKDNAGDMLYVTDSAAVYYCADGKWATLNGKDGEPGKEGTSTVGKAGTSCTAKTVNDGIEISCDGKVIGTVKNGESGTATDGKNGASCKIDDQGKGVVEVTCGENGTPVTLYKAVCGTESYDPAEKSCVDGEINEFCDGNVYNPRKQYCLDLNGVKKIEALLIDDRDKDDVQVYKTVTIKGSYKVTDEKTQTETIVQYEETWMAQNLNYNYNRGSAKSWCGGGEVNTSNEGDCSVYGRLYTWSAAMDSAAVFSDDGKDCGYYDEKSVNNCAASGTVRGACPEGWHLPDNDEWEKLYKAVDAGYVAPSINAVGKKLKSTSGWKNGGNGNDSFGFNVLPAGYRHEESGDFCTVGEYAYFWSSTESTEYTKSKAWRQYFFYLYDDVYRVESFKDFGAFSVRCLKD